MNGTILRHWFWLARKYLKERVFSKELWIKNYTGELSEPEAWLYEIKLPSYIDTFADFGCGAGRNFIPFNGKLQLLGFDIVPYERINWVRNFQNLTYFHTTIEKITDHLPDLSRTLVFTGGTMMCVSGRNQRRFYEACKKAGCRNFIFSEYPPTSKKHSIEHFKLDWPVSETFKLRHPTNDTAWQFIHIE